MEKVLGFRRAVNLFLTTRLNVPGSPRLDQHPLVGEVEWNTMYSVWCIASQVRKNLKAKTSPADLYNKSIRFPQFLRGSDGSWVRVKIEEMTENHHLIFELLEGKRPIVYYVDPVGK